MKKLIIIAFFLVVAFLNSHAQSCFTKNWTGAGTDHMNFYITGATLNGTNLQPGDEIGIYDGTACVGVGVLTQVLTGSNYLSIVASKDDPDTPAKDGYTSGNPISYRLCVSGGTLVITDVVANNPGVFNIGGTAIVVLMGSAPVPTAPVVGTISQPSCLLPTGSVVLSGLPATGTWTLTRSPGGVTTTGTGTSTTISGLAAGTYTYTVTDALGFVSPSSSNIVINAVPNPPVAPLVGTITQATCSVATGSVVLSGLPATGTWTLTRSPGGVTTTGTGTSTTISGLSAGTYTYTVTDAVGCTSVPSGNIVINIQPATPTVPVVGAITQPTCSVATGSVVLSGLPATGTWTLTRSPGGVTTTGTGTSTTISGLSAGTYTYTVTNAEGCTSVPSANVVINVQPSTPPAPVVGAITQPTCSVATGSVVLSGLPATGTWTLTRSPGGVTTTGTGTSTTISGLSAGTYTYTVTNAEGCTSVPSANIVINIQPATPTVPVVGAITQPTCSVATGSVVISGLPATGTWTLTRSPGGVTTTGTGTSTTISDLSAGTYTYTVTNAEGCTSVPSGNIVINAVPNAPAAPVVGAITQPTCIVATGSVVLSGLPATGTWTLTRSPGGVTTTGTGTSTTISGLSAGTYTYTVTNAEGCTSVPSGNVVINVQPSTPTAPVVGAITQPTCSVATGSVVLSGLPATGTWTLTRLPGGVTTTGTGTSTTISGLSTGTYTYTVTSALGCLSIPSGNIVINIQPATPTAPVVGAITQPTCSVATGSVVLSGLPATGTWTLTRSPGGVTTTGTGTSTTISGLSAGTYTYTVTSALGCLSPPSGNIVINMQPATPAAPVVGAITQPTCSVATGSVVLSGLPATGTWTLTRSPGGVTTTGTGTSTTITGLVTGTYTYTVTSALGCLSPPSGNIVINMQPATPAAPVVGAITQPTCSVATGSVVLSGLPATGTWTVTRSPGGVTTTGTGTSTTISGLSAGTYTYTVTNVSGCTSVPSANVVINAVPNAPTAPVVGTITPANCGVATGSVVLSGLPATGTWTLTRLPGGVTTTGTGTSTTISGLTAGTYNYTVTDALGCTSPLSANIVINVQPSTPTAPVVGAITQPTCVVATGSVVLSGLPATGTWTLTRSIGVVTTTGTGTSTTITGLSAGTYTYTVTNAEGCISVPSANIVINVQPATPTAPVVGTITQPTCSVATGSVVLSGLPATGTWTLTRSPGGVTTTGTGTSTTISGLSAGTYTYTVTNAEGCTSVPSANVVINVQPSTPTAPVVGAITQPTCSVATGSVVLSGLPATGTWTLTRSPGGVTTTGTGTSITISGLSAGTYTYTVTDAVGCTSVPSANIVINVQPSTPTAPVVGAITQPTCSVATGSVVLSGLPATGTWTLTRSPGGVTTTGTGTSTTISGLSAGTYTYTVTNASGCTSPSSGNVVLNTPSPCAHFTPVWYPGSGMDHMNLYALTATIDGTALQPGDEIGIYDGNICVGMGTLTQVLNGTVFLSMVASRDDPDTPSKDGYTPGNTITYKIWDSSAGSEVSNTQAEYTLGVGVFAVGATSAFNLSAWASPPTAPVVGTITQPTCNVATGSVILSGLPATGTWTLTRTPGGTTTTGAGTSTTITGLAAGNYTFTVTNASGTSPSSGNVVINSQPATPTAPVVGTITQPTCSVATGSVVLSGLPATGTWTLTRSPGGVTTTGTGTSTTISGLSAGTFTYTVTNAEGCTSIPSGNIVINMQPATPTAPVVGAITQPTCSVAIGSVVLSGLPATGTWTLTRSPGGVTTTGTGTSTTITGLAPGTYTYTVTDAGGCTSPSLASVVINAQPTTPTAPTVGTITQPTCSVATGSVVLGGLPATGTWTLTRTPGAVTTTGTGTSTTITLLATGTYTYTVTNSAGCISVSSGNVVINAVPVESTVAVSSNPLSGGTVSGGGTFSCGASTTVIATPAGGYQFVNWTEGGTQVSTLTSYTFTVTNNRTLVANFSLITGQCNETFTASSGTVTDGSGASNYLDNLSCEKLIQPSGGGTITLTFTAFNTESGYDFVRVYNGSTTSSPLLGSYSGTSLPPVLTANSGSMLIRFTTDVGVTAAGWSANYTTNTTPGTIAVTSPNGGEGWPVGSIQNINWTSNGNSGTVKLEYSTNNGTSWLSIVASTPDDGSHSWTVPNAVSATCLVRVSDTDGIPVDVSNAVFSIIPSSGGGCINETFTASSGTVTDGSGASNYLDNLSCEKLIQPSGGGTITLTFTAFNTESGYDFVRVYNGSTTSSPLLGSYSGTSLPPVLTANSGSMLIRFTTDVGVTAAGWSANYTTNTTPGTIAVTSPNGGEGWPVGSIQNINWTSNGNSGTVKLEYSTNNGTSWLSIVASTPDDGSHSWTVPNAVSATCLVRVSDTDGIPVDVSNAVFSIIPSSGGGCINETFTASSGTVTDGSGASNYLDNLSCEKLIQPSGGGTITLTFTAFNTESGYDFVRVYNGSTTSSPLLGSYSGTSLPPVLTANSGSMLIRFTTDVGVTAAGWSANYTTNTTPGTIAVTSPNGGEGWPVGSIQNINWTSNGNSGTVKLEYSTNNGTSWLSIVASTPDDGSHSWTVPNAVSATCLVRVSDTDGIPVDVSNAVFSIIPSSGGGCINETFTASSGTVTDGSGASNYLDNLSCEKLIQPSGGGTITLTFTAFNTESGYDFVRVYNGSTTSSPLLGSYSGTSLPPVLTANSGSMLIRFTTDVGVTAAGWSANYTTNTTPGTIAVTSPNGGEGWPVGSIQNINWTSNGNSGTVKLEYSTNNGTSWLSIVASTPDDGSQSWTVPNAVSATCLVRVSDTDGIPVDVSNAVFSIIPSSGGGCINETFTASSGTVTDGSGASNYLDNLSCEKLIQPSGGGTITLTFTAFNTESGYDFVRVYNGSTTSSPLLGSYSGTSLPPVLTANSGSMLIRFTTDVGVTAAGWSANYTTNTTPGTIAVATPNGGEVWQVGSIQNINWTSNGNSGTVKLEYSTNNGTSWLSIVASTPDDGSQSWTVPNAVSATCLVRVSDTDGSPVDVSNAVFSIIPSSGGGCINETFTASSGTVTDGSGASNYLDNLSCEKLIQPSGGGTITLTFTAFNTESGYDFVRVYNGSTTSSPLLGTYSGTSLPPVLTANSGSMLIRFTTDVGVTAAGWSANYTTSASPVSKGSEPVYAKAILPETDNSAIKYVAYPNPTAGILTIESSIKEEETYTIDLLNSSGQVVFNQKVNVIGGKHIIDISNVSYGFYILRIKNDRTVHFIRVIKN